MKIIFNFLTIVFIMITAGCSTTNSFNKVPIESSEFSLSKINLSAQYPDVEKYEKAFRGFRPNTPLVNDLIAIWGEPDRIKKQVTYPLLMGGTFAACAVAFGPIPTLIAGTTTVAIRPYTPEYYYWKKESYCIEANLDKTFENGYKKRVISWHWYDLRAEDNVPKECKE